MSGPVAISNFPVIQTITGSVGLSGPITGTVGLSGPVAVSNFPATQSVTQGTSPWVISGSNWIPTITGSVGLSGPVTISNFPSVQTVTGSVGIEAPISIGQWLGSSTPTVGQKATSASIPVVIASDQSNLKIIGAHVTGTQGTTNPVLIGGVTTSGDVQYLNLDSNGNIGVVIAANQQALPLIINMNFEKSDGAILENAYKRVMEYTVPAGFNGWLIRFSSFQNEDSKSRIVSVKKLGSYNVLTGVYTFDESYEYPQWSGVAEAEVTTAFSSAGASVVITVTYTNEKSVAGRIGTFSIPKSSIVGSRFRFTFQSGDLGLTSIQSITDNSPNTGVVDILGNIQLAYHNDISNKNQLETNYQPGAIAFPSGTLLAVEYSGGTVSKDRLFDLLIQLVTP